MSVVDLRSHKERGTDPSLYQFSVDRRDCFACVYRYESEGCAPCQQCLHGEGVREAFMPIAYDMPFSVGHFGAPLDDLRRELRQFVGEPACKTPS